ncbi:hypothetical protein M2352_003792 [Azospirillum fermentarium]|uniref:hypothetical protein n=1 Tax=Azospirillum fermentarium TaxID=1233114 RepID=UPI0022268875|nr:hypothetical protein [Azospirillum fermentarium]MCW2248158.1 hypothetical protein [Azospirillum fermentarium]
MTAPTTTPATPRAAIARMKPATLPLGGLRPARRQSLPKPHDRLPLGLTGMTVSPLALGITTPDTVLAAYDMGINFFFLTSDLHWPLYQGLRDGLAELFRSRPSARDEVVVAVVSYLDQPLFNYLQFNEVIDSVPGLERVDVLMAGAVPSEANLYSRFNSLHGARSARHFGGQALGASFHHRPAALLSINANLLDVHFIRYNTSHPGAVTDIFPYARPDRTGLIFNFKSTMSQVTPEQFRKLGLDGRSWLPKTTDYYRFALTVPGMDGVLCSPQSPEQLNGIVEALNAGPLSAEEEAYMRWLSSSVNPQYF